MEAALYWPRVFLKSSNKPQNDEKSTKLEEADVARIKVKCQVLFMIYQSLPHFLGTDADLSNSCFVYLVHPGWRGCALLPAGPSCPPRSSHPPAMKGSPVSTTSEQGWKCGSSLKGRIELLWSQNYKKKKGAHESGKGLGGEGDNNCNNWEEINQITHTETSMLCFQN